MPPLQNLHESGVLERTLRKDPLKKMKCDLQRWKNIFDLATKTNEAAV
jgi:hypothetical protein